VPQDWFDDKMENLDQDDELNQSVENSSSDTRHNQVFPKTIIIAVTVSLASFCGFDQSDLSC